MRTQRPPAAVLDGDRRAGLARHQSHLLRLQIQMGHTGAVQSGQTKQHAQRDGPDGLLRQRAILVEQVRQGGFSGPVRRGYGAINRRPDMRW